MLDGVRVDNQVSVILIGQIDFAVVGFKETQPEPHVRPYVGVVVVTLEFGHDSRVFISVQLICFSISGYQEARG